VDWTALLARDPFEARFHALVATALPDHVGTLARTGFRNEHRDRDDCRGEHSRTWTYAGPSRAVDVALDAPFVDWHDPTLCYQARGWRMTARSTQAASRVPEGGAPRIVAEFQSDQGQFAYLVFGVFNRQDQPLEEASTMRRLALYGARWRTWFGRQDDDSGRPGEQISYQVHVFTAAHSTPTPAEREELDALFDAAVTQVARAQSVAAFRASAGRSQP
jgi:hypothetical protein